MAPPQGQSQSQSSSRRRSDVPNGLPSVSSTPQQESVPATHPYAPNIVTYKVPATTLPTGSEVLPTANGSAQAHRDKLQLAFNEIDSIMQNRIRSILNDQHSDYWNTFWQQHYANQFAVTEDEKIKLGGKAEDLKAQNNAVKSERARLRRQRTASRKTVFRLSSLLALRTQKTHQSTMEIIRLRARVMDLEVEAADASGKYDEDLIAKQRAFDKAKTELQAQINSFQQEIFNLDESFTTKQKAIDEEIQLRKSSEHKLQKASDKMFDLKRELFTSRNTHAALQKRLNEAKEARDQAKKSADAERTVRSRSMTILQVDIESANAVIEYLKQRCSRFAHQADTYKLSAARLRGDIESMQLDYAAIESQATGLTQQLIKEQNERNLLNRRRTKLQSEIDESSRTIDELSCELRKRNVEKDQLQSANSKLQSRNSMLHSRLVHIVGMAMDDKSTSEDVRSIDAAPRPDSNKHPLPQDDPQSPSAAAFNTLAKMPHNELTPRKTSHLARENDVPAARAAPSPVESRELHPLPPLPSASLRGFPEPLSKPSNSTAPEQPAGNGVTTSAQSSSAPTQTAYRVLSREQLAEVGRIRKRPGTEIKPPTGPKSSMPQRRPGSSDGEWSSKRRKMADCYRP